MGSEAGIGPSNSWFFKEGDVPWIFKKDDISLAKEVIMDVRVPTSTQRERTAGQDGGERQAKTRSSH